jgi:glycosyltransferase involved in cell wall biosynthesis
MAIIPNPINPEFNVKPFSGKRRKIITSVGRLSEQKNQHVLIEAFSRIEKDFPDYELVIYGEGNLRETLENQIKTLKLENKVKLPGVKKNIKNEIYDCSLFVLPSLYEGMPNALMEAMALGLPVISTDCPCGGPRFLIHNYNGLLVKVNNV